MTRTGSASRALGIALAAYCLWGTSLAAASPVPAALSLSGTIDFDMATDGGNFSTLVNAGNRGHTGLTSGGALTTSEFSGLTPAGADPLTGPLSQTGDGIQVDAIAVAGTGGSYSIETLGTLNLTNTSSTVSYKLTLRATTNATVDANGTDAFSEFEFDFGPALDPSGLLTYDLVSDTLGDANPQSVDEFIDIEVILAPLQATQLFAFWNWSGTSFDGDASLEFVASLALLDVVALDQPPEPVPAPAPLALLLTGLVSLGVARRRR